MSLGKSGEPLALFTRAFEAEARGEEGNALTLYKMAARRGFASAMINIGNIYDNPGHLRNPRLARYWYKKALAKGMREGASNLAVHFKINKNMRWYFYWLQKAANLGDEESIRELSHLRKESH